MDMLPIMQRILQWIALAIVMLSLSSCGLPGALIRSTGNLVKGVGTVAGPLVGPALTGGVL
jgi:hypothetical protein